MAKSYANDFNIDSKYNDSIIFMGQPGFGKTHLALAIANYIIKNGVGVVYMNYREQITAIKQNIMDSERYNLIISRYKNARCVIIDDLFKGSVSQSDINIMYDIINHFYITKKPLIITTERYLKDLLTIDEALGSRIIEMCGNNSLEIIGKNLNYRLNIGG